LKNMGEFIPYFDSIRQRPSCALFLVFSILSLFLGTTFSSCSPHRQNHRSTPEPKSPDQIIKEMKSQLNLNNEQQAKIRPIIEDQVKRRYELIKKYQAEDRQSMDSFRDELKDLRIITERQLQYFLTSEQMIDYGYMQQEEDRRISSAKMQEERPEKPQGRERRPRNFPR
jgi:hypothetical protein